MKVTIEKWSGKDHHKMAVPAVFFVRDGKVAWAHVARHYKTRPSTEEVLVLESTFSDEHGDYPAGTWMRSPHASEHQPFSRMGCLIDVTVGHLLPPAVIHS